MTSPTYRLEIELEGLPTMRGNARWHWRERHRHDAAWKERVAWAAKIQGLPEKPLEHAHVEVIRFSSVEPDFDGLVAAGKPAVDALIGSVIVDDSPSHLTRRYVWCKAERNKGRMRMTVTERRP